MASRYADTARYLQRDREAVVRSRADYWAEVLETDGPGAVLSAAGEIRRMVAAANPGWPTEADRAADLASHIRVSELMRRAFPR